MSELRPGELKPEQIAAVRNIVPRIDERQKPSEPRRWSRRGFIGLAVGAIGAVIGIKSYLDSRSTNVDTDPTVSEPEKVQDYQDAPYLPSDFASKPRSEHDSLQQQPPIDLDDPDAVPIPEPVDIDRGYRRTPGSEPGVPVMKPTNFLVTNPSEEIVAYESKDSKKGPQSNSGRDEGA